MTVRQQKAMREASATTVRAPFRSTLDGLYRLGLCELPRQGETDWYARLTTDGKALARVNRRKEQK
jgi:hypothetical protein